MLLKWLNSRKYLKEASHLEAMPVALSRFSLLKTLCEIFVVEADDMIISAALGMLPEKMERNFPEIKAQYRAIASAEVKADAKTESSSSESVVDAVFSTTNAASGSAGRLWGNLFTQDNIAGTTLEEKDDYVDIVKGIVFAQVGNQSNNININLRNDLGADDLDMIEILEALEEEFDIEMDDDDLDDIETMKQLIDCVKSYLA
jgi:acyl carrier protein